MLKLLIKKQLAEIFRSYFYDAKTGKAKPKKKTITSMVLFACIMVFLVGGSFFGLAMGFGQNTCGTEYAWFYYVIFEIIAVLVGVFGSVFTTYSALYLSKDNDLLLSMPIPVSTIIASRIFAVYLLGVIYSAVIYIPAVAVDFVYAGWRPEILISGIIMLLSISLIVLILSCILGYAVARISLVLTNKSIGKVLIGLVFLGAYYLIYFKLMSGIESVMSNPGVYGENLKANAYILYKFGAIGGGDLTAGIMLLGILAVLTGLMWYLIAHSFIKTATATGRVKKAKGKALQYGSGTVKKAVFRKELSRFTSSAGYMMNSGFGILILPIAGIALAIKSGAPAMEYIKAMGYFNIIITAIIMMICSTMCISAASVSLEGKNIWIYQSMPIDARDVLKGKLKLHIVLCMPSVLITASIAAVMFACDIIEGIFMVAMPVLFTVLCAVAGLWADLRSPNLTWSSEIVVIKQGIPVVITLFGGWGFSVVFGGLYFLAVALKIYINRTVYMAVFIALIAAAAVWLYRRIMSKGAEIFSKL